MARLRLLLNIPPSLLFFLLVLASSSMAAEVPNILNSGEILKTGEFLSYGEAYRLVMKTDCNLVLYEFEVPIWDTKTDDLGLDCYCEMHKDGNLAVHASDGKWVWSSESCKACSEGKYVLILQDRNLVIYGRALWAANTDSKPLGMEPIVITTTTDDVDHNT